MRRLMSILLAVVLALTASRTRAATGEPADSSLKVQMSAAEFERAGLHRLTPVELAALESWLASKYAGSARASTSSLVGSVPARGTERATQLVAFNTSNGKYHCASCQ
jgi:hypothetical protein